MRGIGPVIAWQRIGEDERVFAYVVKLCPLPEEPGDVTNAFMRVTLGEYTKAARAVAWKQDDWTIPASMKDKFSRYYDGHYGECLECGEQIADGRLDIDPATPFCIACADQQDS